MYNTFLLLEEVMRHTHKSLGKNLEPYGLYKGQPKILWLLSVNTGITKKEIAERYKVSMPTVSKTIERLEKNGFVTSKHDEIDKRKNRVYITEKGIKVEHELIAFKKQYANKIFKDISDEDIENLERILEQMKLNVLEYNNEKND